MTGLDHMKKEREGHDNSFQLQLGHTVCRFFHISVFCNIVEYVMSPRCSRSAQRCCSLLLPGSVQLDQSRGIVGQVILKVLVSNLRNKIGHRDIYSGPPMPPS